MKIKPWKRFWVIVNAKGCALPWTLSGTKSGAMSNLYGGLSQEQKEDLWEKNLKEGYCAVKVNVKFEPS
jgi:hypothetical protein